MQTKELLEPLSIKSRPLTNLTFCDRKFHKNKHSDRQTMRFIQSRSNANFAGPMFESGFAPTRINDQCKEIKFK